VSFVNTAVYLCATRWCGSFRLFTSRPRNCSAISGFWLSKHNYLPPHKVTASCFTPSCCLAWQHPTYLVTIAFCYCTLQLCTPGGAGYTWQFRMTSFCTLFSHNLYNAHVTKAFFFRESRSRIGRFCK